MGAVPDPKTLAMRKAVQEKIIKACSITRRSGWGASPPDKALDPDWDYDSLVVHYTGHNSYPTMKSIQELDMAHDRDWNDIAYHYAISGDGQIFEGREILFKGSDVLHQNTGKIGIVCMGDYDSNWRNWGAGKSYSGDPVPAVLLASLKKLSVCLQQNFPIRFFGGHIEYGKTEMCPGSNLLPLVKEMRTQLNLQAPTYKVL